MQVKNVNDSRNTNLLALVSRKRTTTHEQEKQMLFRSKSPVELSVLQETKKTRNLSYQSRATCKTKTQNFKYKET